MKNRRLFTFVYVIILFLIFPVCVMAAPVGKVTHIERNVDIIKTGVPAARTMLLGESVDLGDIVRTKSKGKVEITFSNQNVLRIAASSRVVIQEYMIQGDNSKLAVELYRGMVQAIASADFIKRLATSPDQNKLEVKTNNAICGIRGSNMVVSYFGGVTSVLFISGSGYAYNPMMPKIPVTIIAGKIVFIEKKDTPPTPPRPATTFETMMQMKAVTPSEKPEKDMEQIKGGTSSYLATPGPAPSVTSSSVNGAVPVQNGTSPGVSSTSSVQSVASPGLSGTSPGQSDTSPGLSGGTPPGLSGGKPPGSKK